MEMLRGRGQCHWAKDIFWLLLTFSCGLMQHERLSFVSLIWLLSRLWPRVEFLLKISKPVSLYPSRILLFLKKSKCWSALHYYFFLYFWDGNCFHCHSFLAVALNVIPYTQEADHTGSLELCFNAEMTKGLGHRSLACCSQWLLLFLK